MSGKDGIHVLFDNQNCTYFCDFLAFFQSTCLLFRLVTSFDPFVTSFEASLFMSESDSDSEFEWTLGGM